MSRNILGITFFDPKWQRQSAAQTDFTGIKEYASPSYDIAPFLPGAWSVNSACAVNSIALLNECCHSARLRINRKIPSSARNMGRKGITLWLTHQLYKCVDKKMGGSRWREGVGGGLNLIEEYRHLWPCKAALMKKLGIKEKLCVQHANIPLTSPYALPPVPLGSDGNALINVTTVQLSEDQRPSEGAWPNEACPCVVGGQVRVSFANMLAGHAATVTVTKCNSDGSMEGTAQEHPYQAGDSPYPGGLWGFRLDRFGAVSRASQMAGLRWLPFGNAISTMCCCEE